MLFSTQLNSPICYELHAKTYRTERRTTFFPLLPPTLLARALKAAVTLVHVPENRELLCRNFHKVALKAAAYSQAWRPPAEDMELSVGTHPEPGGGRAPRRLFGKRCSAALCCPQAFSLLIQAQSSWQLQ